MRRVARSARRRSVSARGFGLLEALVALVLLSVVGMATFDWIGANVGTANRLLSLEQAQRDRQQAQAWAITLNPMTQPQGETPLASGGSLRWQARALAPPVAVAPLPGGAGSPWLTAVYELELEIVADDGRPTQTWTLRRLGHRRAIQGVGP